MRKLKWIDIAGEDGLLDCRQVIQRPAPPSVHSHDFPEIFWIESGEGTHLINGESVRLAQGDLVFMRPDDSHGYAKTGRMGLKLMNLAYSPLVRRHFLRRYGAEAKRALNPDGPLPFQMRLDSLALENVSRSAWSLVMGEPSLAALDKFLLELLLLASGSAESSVMEEEIPEWLRAARLKASEPEIFVKGVSAFVPLCGRSPEHVAREFRKSFGCSPSDWINSLRLDYAASLLRSSQTPVKEIASDCGWKEASFFHRAFKRRFGSSPRLYRRSSLKTVV